MQFSARVLNITPSQTLASSAKAAELILEGHDVVNLTVGEPDFEAPPEVLNAINEAMQAGKTRYSAASGVAELKKAIAGKMQRDHNLEYSPNEIFVGVGAKHVLYNAFQSILNDGDEVIIPGPFWVSYPEQVKLAGGVPVIIDTDESTEFKLTTAQLDAAITDKTRAILLNSPSNPTGSVYTQEEITKLAKYLEQKDIWIISDEIYEKLIYDGAHYSIAQHSEILKEKTVIINGLSKSHAMTGLRIGYACATAEMIKRMTDLTAHSTSNVPTPIQYGSVEAFNLGESYATHNRELFKKRRESGYKLITEIPYVECVKPGGAFYFFPNFKETAKRTGFDSVDALCDAILTEAHVAVVAGSSFSSPDNIRLSYATSEENFVKAIERIQKFVKSKLEGVQYEDNN